MKSKVFNFAAGLTIIDSANKSFQDLQRICADLTNAYSDQIEAETKLATVMRNNMDATDAEIQSIKDLCAKQQKLGVIGDEVQLAGAHKMASHLSEKQSLEDLIPAIKWHNFMLSLMCPKYLNLHKTI